MSIPNSRVKGKNEPRRSRLAPEVIEKIQTLAMSGISLRAISRQTKTNYSTIHSYAKQFSKQQTTFNYSALDKRELGYIVGFFVGDGSRIEEKRSGHYGAKFALDAKRDSDVADFLSHLFKKSGKRVTAYSEGSCLNIKVYSKRLLRFLENYVNYEESSKTLVNPLSWSKEFIFGFLGGLIDADGHVLKNKRKTGHFGVVITTVNKIMVQQLVSVFGLLSLEANVGRADPCKTSYSKKPTYFIRLGKAEFSKVCNNLICIKHQRCACNTKHF